MDMIESNHRRHSFALTSSREFPQRLSDELRGMSLQLYSYGQPLSYSIILRPALCNQFLQLIGLGFMQFSVRSFNERFHEGKWGHTSHPVPGSLIDYCLMFTQLHFLGKHYFKKLKHYTICSVIENRRIRNE
jgi:hypothetical protein